MAQLQFSVVTAAAGLGRYLPQMMSSNRPHRLARQESRNPTSLGDKNWNKYCVVYGNKHLHLLIRYILILSTCQQITTLGFFFFYFHSKMQSTSAHFCLLQQFVYILLKANCTQGEPARTAKPKVFPHVETQAFTSS